MNWRMHRLAMNCLGCFPFGRQPSVRNLSSLWLCVSHERSLVEIVVVESSSSSSSSSHNGIQERKEGRKERLIHASQLVPRRQLVPKRLSALEYELVFLFVLFCFVLICFVLFLFLFSKDSSQDSFPHGRESKNARGRGSQTNSSTAREEKEGPEQRRP